MKASLALLSVGLAGGALVSCTTGPQAPTASTGLPYAAYATTTDVQAPVNPAYRTWTTAQLQQRRHELYYMIPQTQTRQQIPVYSTRGNQLPQQDEIRAIEAELNRRYHNGDRAALLEPTWPEARRHVS